MDETENSRCFEDMIKEKKSNQNDLVNKTLDEIAEEISIYHEELIQQNHELVRIQKELETTKEHYFHLFESAPIGYVVYSEDFSIIATNKAFNALIKCKSLKNKKITEFIHPEYQDTFYFYQQHLDNNNSNSLQLILLAEGTEIPVKIQSNIYIEDGNRLIRSGIIDISSEKKVEKALIDAAITNKKFFTAVEQSASSIIITDNNGLIEYANPKLLKTIGLPIDKLKGRSLDTVFKDEIKINNMIYKLSTGNEHRGEFQYREKANEVHWEIGSISPVFNEKNVITHFVLVSEDITLRKKVEANLNHTNLLLSQANEKAKEASDTKNHFLANMSHEIRTPLNGILGFLYLLENTNINNEQKDFINKIKLSTETLSNVVNDILDITKIESGKLTFEEIEFPLVSTIEAAVIPFVYQSSRKGIPLEAIYHNLPNKAMGDPLRLRQVITNLLNNAVKFTEKGNITLKVEALEEANGLVKISFEVTDTGIGIEDTTIEKLFTPFTQGDSSAARKFGGSGLGLAICKKIVNMMNGEIAIESNIGKGTTVNFYVLFKKVIDEAMNTSVDVPSSNNKALEGLTEVKDRKGVEGMDKDKPKILLVEDNEISRDFFVKLIGIEGLSCDIAKNGIEAVELCSAKEYDIVFMDCQMPLMDGYEATKRIRQQEEKKKHQVIIAITAHAMKGDEEKCVAAGMDDYISKPINHEAVVRMIDKYYFEKQSASQSQYSKVLDTLMEESSLDRGTCKEILDEFIKHATQLLNRIHVELLDKNHIELGNILHQLKGTAGNVRAKDISKAALAAEEAIKDGRMKDLQTNIRSISDKLMELNTPEDSML